MEEIYHIVIPGECDYGCFYFSSYIFFFFSFQMPVMSKCYFYDFKFCFFVCFLRAGKHRLA